MEIYNILIDDKIGAGGITTKFIRSEIEAAKAAGAKSLRLVINSNGGSVYEGYSIYNTLKGCGLPIDTYVNGECSSIATLIAMAGGRIETAELSQWMFHKPSGGAEGNASDLQSTAKALEQIEETMAKCYADRMGKDVGEGLALMSKGDNYLKPEDLKQLGIVNNVTKPIYAKSNKQFMNIKDKLTAGFKALEESIKALTGEETPVAGSMFLKDGSTKIYFEGSDIQEGKTLFTDPEMTMPASEGDHMLEDGKMVTLDATGKIVRVLEAPDASGELATSLAEIETLKQALALKDTEIEAINAKNVETVTEIQNQVTALKATVFSAENKVKQKQIDEEGTDKPVNGLDIQAAAIAQKMAKRV